MHDSLLLILLMIACVSQFAIVIMLLSGRRKTKTLTHILRQEVYNLRHELNTKTNAIELAAYQKEPGDETVIYDSDAGNPQDEFTGQVGRAWDYVTHQFSPGEGRGNFQTGDGTITITRTNTGGRYELHLKNYGYKNSLNKIPADGSTRLRRMRLSCEVKRGQSAHVLRFVFKGDVSHNVLDEKEYVVFNPDWETVNVVFCVSTAEPCYLRIDDLMVWEAPGHIQLRHIILYQKS